MLFIAGARNSWEFPMIRSSPKQSDFIRIGVTSVKCPIDWIDWELLMMPMNYHRQLDIRYCRFHLDNCGAILCEWESHEENFPRGSLLKRWYLNEKCTWTTLVDSRQHNTVSTWASIVRVRSSSLSWVVQYVELKSFNIHKIWQLVDERQSFLKKSHGCLSNYTHRWVTWMWLVTK